MAGLIPVGFGLVQPAISTVSVVAGVTLNPTTGTEKNSALTLSGSNLIATVDNAGLDEYVRATSATSQAGAFEFEVTINTVGNLSLGIDNGLTDFSLNNQLPGSSNSNGVAIQWWTTNNWFIVRSGGVSQGPFASPTPGSTDKITIRCNKSGGTIGFYRNGTQIGVNETGVSFTNWYAFVGGRNLSSLTANFAGPFSFGTDPAY